jgi:hypothetical protein
MGKLQILLALPFLMLAASCINEDQLSHQDSNIVEWTFHPNLDNVVPASKAIGDAGKVDQLRAVVYKEIADGLSLENTVTESWSKVQKDGVSFKLKDDETYKIVFWAEDKDNTAYSFGNDGTVSADYTDYLNGGFAKMEELDAFCYTTVISPETPYDNSQKVVLRRPLGQLNFVDVTQAKKGEDVVKVTFHSIPTVFDPFTGSVKSTDPIDESDDMTFTFSDFTSEERITNVKSVKLLGMQSYNRDETELFLGDYALIDGKAYYIKKNTNINEFDINADAVEINKLEITDGVHFYMNIPSSVNPNLIKPLDDAIAEALVLKIMHSWFLFSYPQEAEVYAVLSANALAQVYKRCNVFNVVHSKVPRIF